jgi:hypothetical protein
MFLPQEAVQRQFEAKHKEEPSDSIDKTYQTEASPNTALLIHLKGADSCCASKTSNIQAQETKVSCVERLMTLKQAYPPECQRVQGAFKDSMIH